MDEADFYTGLVAQLYSPLRSADPDPDPYAGFIAACGEPALELGCGDGDPMLALRARGIDVVGVDSSGDMLDRLRVRAAAMGLDVEVHQQRMQDLDLGRHFPSIYLAGPTFCLLPDDAAAAALAAIQAHLEPGGSVLIPLFVPEALPAEAIGRASERVGDDGTVLRFTVLAEHLDPEARRLVRSSRYESVPSDGTTTETTDRDWLLHWYTQDGFRELAAGAGLTVAAVLRPDASPAGADDNAFVFWLTRPS